jgi:hypothetical protein
MKRQSKLFVYLLSAAMLAASAVATLPGTASAQTLEPLSSLQAGNTVSFAGNGWIVLNPATGYLMLKSYWGGVGGLVFEPGTPGNNVFNPNKQGNVGWYLNNYSYGFYQGISAADQALIQTHSWTTGPNDGSGNNQESSSCVDCKIGLISYSEYIRYKAYIPSSVDSAGYWWTRTPVYGSTDEVWSVDPNGNLYGGMAADTYVTCLVYPTLYLDPDILVSGGNGGTVTAALGTPLITVVNGAPFSVTVDNTYGTLTGTNATYGITGTDNGNGGNVITGTLSGLTIGTPIDVPLGCGVIEVEAVNPPSTTLDNTKSFY